METNRESSSRHKQWRRLARKERRRRVRRKAAQERDADEERLRAALERSAEYLNWLEEQEKEEKEGEAREQEQRAEREKLWLEEEARAHKEWQARQERKAKARQDQLVQEEIIRKEFEAKQEAMRKKKEEAKRLQDEEIQKHKDMQKRIDDYIDNGAETPEHLRMVSESQSGKEPCPFFTKTGACRYGDICSRNHRRVSLSKVILVPGFYSHFSMEKNSAEYDTDISLEFESSETRQHFREFYKDVVPELESFGRIKTLKYCCNTEIHLRGNLYVEYCSEREAARAWRRLKGRYYAGRQLNCEFVNLKSWRSAVCGMNKCPKGRACNFLHTFRNPHDEYDIKSPLRWPKKNEGSEGTTSSGSSSRRSEQRTKSKWEEMDRCSSEDKRNWRWSESPEPQVAEHRSKNDRTRRHTEERGERRNTDEKRKTQQRVDSRQSSRSERRGGEGDRSSSRNSKIDSDSQKKIIISSSRKSRRSKSEYKDEENTDYHREEYSSKHREKKSKKMRRDDEANGKKRDSRRNCQDRRTKALMKNVEKMESLHGGGEKMMEGREKEKSEIETFESDENIDTNLKDSCANVIENIESLQSENTSLEKTVQAPQSKWDAIESRSSAQKKYLKSCRSSPIIVRDKQDVASPLREKRSLSASDNEWDTTDSENE